MMTEIGLAFVAGLTGSFHCIGMCGGIVTALAMTCRNSAFKSRIASQLFYNLGRVLTYALLGMAAGFIGSALDMQAMKSFGRWFFIVANLFVIVVGLSSAAGFSWLNLSTFEGSAGRFLARPLRQLLSGRSPLSALPLGMLLGLLPCGMVYAPLVVAMGSGSALHGGAIMLALGLGTVPLLFIFGSASSAISGRVREIMFRLAGVAVALMGAAGLWRTIGKMAH